MKHKGLIKIGILFCLIILSTNTASATIQYQGTPERKSLLHLQFVLTINWDGTNTSTPIAAGETREVPLQIISMVTRGVFGKILLRLLEGKTYIVQLSIIDKPEWCVAWYSQENLTGVIKSEESTVYYSSLFIHLTDDAPGNYTQGWVKMSAQINDKKGPFNFFTLIHSFEQQFTVSFVNN